MISLQSRKAKRLKRQPGITTNTCQHPRMRCEERNVQLNEEKFKLRQSGLLFIGHVATDKGLRVEPAKVPAIVEMATPTDKAGCAATL